MIDFWRETIVDGRNVITVEHYWDGSTRTTHEVGQQVQVAPMPPRSADDELTISLAANSHLVTEPWDGYFSL